jgi:hypothetical protein
MMNNKRTVKSATLFIFVVLITSFCIPQNIKGNNQKDASCLSQDQEDLALLKWMGPHGSYNDYLQGRVNKSFTLTTVEEPSEDPDSPLLVVFIHSDLYPLIQDEFTLYMDTLNFLGYNTVGYEISGGTVENMKDQLLLYWDNNFNITGAVIIGDLPVAWFYNELDFYAPAEFPCDLFLMDLDGTWSYNTTIGMYDSHIDGEGDTAPEIYVGRIDASNINGDEIVATKAYFQKVYDFWTGTIQHTDVGLTYTDKTWSDRQHTIHDISFAYENYVPLWYQEPDSPVTRSDYKNNQLTNGSYEFIQLACHSSSNRHCFEIGGHLYSNEIRSTQPQALFYNLFCCGALRFTDYNCLGNAYILNTDSPSLAVVGSTKSGSMKDFLCFYMPLGDGCSFGEAFQQWFEFEYPYSHMDICWFYGMMILGDPTLVPTYEYLIPSAAHSTCNYTIIKDNPCCDAGLRWCPGGDMDYIVLEILVRDDNNTPIPNCNISLTLSGECDPYYNDTEIQICGTPSRANKTDSNGYTQFKITGGGTGMLYLTWKVTVHQLNGSTVLCNKMTPLFCVKSPDFTGDRSVNFFDTFRYLPQLNCASGWSADFNCDGRVNFFDTWQYLVHLNRPDHVCTCTQGFALPKTNLGECPLCP